MRRLLLLSASLGVACAGSFTSVSISDEKACYDDSAIGTTSAASVGFPRASCPDGSYAAPGTGSAAAFSNSVSVMGSASDTTGNILLPFDLSFVESFAGSSRWVEVYGIGAGELDFTITTDGAALSDTGLASSSIAFAGTTVAACTIGFGTTSCHGTHLVTIPFTYGVPFELDFSAAGSVEAGASLKLEASYALTSGQDLIDVPEPNTALIFLFGFGLQLWIRTLLRRDGITRV